MISVKRCLLNVENVDDKTSISLFITTSSKTSMDNASRLSILAHRGPGCTPNEPIVLVASFLDSNKMTSRTAKPEAVLLPSQEGTPLPFEKRYRKHCELLLTVAHCTDQFI